MRRPQPGDIVLLQIRGWVGWLVWIMQLINRDLSKWTHVGVMMHDNQLFEAQPGGAVMTDWKEYQLRPYAIVTKKQVPHTAGSATHGYVYEPLDLSSFDRDKIVEEAFQHLGAGYNWTTYFYLACYRFYIRPEWLKRRVQDSDRLICSQAADEIYTNVGLRLFSDGRMPYDVTPGDLALLT